MTPTGLILRPAGTAKTVAPAGPAGPAGPTSPAILTSLAALTGLASVTSRTHPRERDATAATTTDILEEVRRRFLPGPKARVSTPQSR